MNTAQFWAGVVAPVCVIMLAAFTLYTYGVCSGVNVDCSRYTAANGSVITVKPGYIATATRVPGPPLVFGLIVGAALLVAVAAWAAEQAFKGEEIPGAGREEAKAELVGRLGGGISLPEVRARLQQVPMGGPEVPLLRVQPREPHAGGLLS